MHHANFNVFRPVAFQVWRWQQRGYPRTWRSLPCEATPWWRPFHSVGSQCHGLFWSHDTATVPPSKEGWSTTVWQWQTQNGCLERCRLHVSLGPFRSRSLAPQLQILGRENRCCLSLRCSFSFDFLLAIPERKLIDFAPKSSWDRWPLPSFIFVLPASVCTLFTSSGITSSGIDASTPSVGDLSILSASSSAGEQDSRNNCPCGENRCLPSPFCPSPGCCTVSIGGEMVVVGLAGSAVALRPRSSATSSRSFEICTWCTRVNSDTSSWP